MNRVTTRPFVVAVAGVNALSTTPTSCAKMAGLAPGHGYNWLVAIRRLGVRRTTYRVCSTICAGKCRFVRFTARGTYLHVIDASLSSARAGTFRTRKTSLRMSAGLVGRASLGIKTCDEHPQKKAGGPTA